MNRKQKIENREWKTKNTEHTRFFVLRFLFPRKAGSRGFTLFYAVLITSLLLSIALAVFNITLKELILSSDARESQNAFYSADTALECALFWDNSATPAFGFYGDSLASGITSYWRFDEGSGEDAFDTGSGNDDGVLLPNGSGPTWVDGYVNDALSFNGVDQYVGLEDTVTYEDEFTVSFWGQPVWPITTGQRIVLEGTNGRFGLRFNGSQNQFRVSIGGVTTDVNATGVGFGGAWTHYVLRRDGNNDVDIIVNNGTPVSVGNRDGTFDIDFIGQGTGDSYEGTLDEIRIYNRALSDEEIGVMYQGESNNIFVDPVEQNSNVTCAGADISNPDTGWDVDPESEKPLGWDIVTDVDSAVTTFDMSFQNGRCAYVTVSKNTASTTIVARGYNTCTLNDNRRLERALRAEY